jgi:hypothetical protein
VNRLQHGPHAITPFAQELGALPPAHWTEHVWTLVQVTWQGPVQTASQVCTASQTTDPPGPTSTPQSGVLLQVTLQSRPQMTPHRFV